MKNISELVLPIIRETRDILLPQWGKAEVVDQKSNEASDVVTALDRVIETFLAERLKVVDPSITFAGEEFGGVRTDERFWLCDPIDGTSHYIRGTPFCTVMLALIEKGRVNFSVIYDFVNNIAYHAERGKGAWKDTERIHVSTRALAQAYLTHESRLEKPENLEIYMKLRQKGGYLKIFEAGWDFAMVASGKLEGRIQVDPYGKDYDFAPGSLLVEEAGGVVANLGSCTYDYRNTDFIAANPVVYKELTEGPDAVFPTS